MSLHQAEVTCQVMRPEVASSFVSNVFNFTFGFEGSVTLRNVLPLNIEEATIICSLHHEKIANIGIGNPPLPKV